MNKKISLFYLMALAAMIFLPSHTVIAQTEVMAWGNMTGIRVDGQLIEFESSFRVVEKDWSGMDFTGRERQQTAFSRTGASQKVNSSVLRVKFEQTVEDRGKGVAAVSLSYNSDTTRSVEGVFYCFELPNERYANGTVKIGGSTLKIAPSDKVIHKASGKRIIVESSGRNIKIDFSASVNVFLRNENEGDITVLYVKLLDGNLKKGQKGSLNFTITASGDIDNTPVEVIVDRSKPGRLFEGLGGNFRLQNPTNDPQVIDYCLNNLRVAFGRVEMPWGIWQPDENTDPLVDARAGKLNERADRSMKMAQRLSAKGMPVIVSAWFPPDWAVAGNPRAFRGGGIAALRLNPKKTQKIYQSITSYLIHLKQAYGVEAYAFSFNESDIGINVLHTPQEHADFIKGLGAYMASQGLATKMLLGDNSDATTLDFVIPALNDSQTHKYIAAVSFHSWRGCDDETLRKWAGYAQQLNVPLIIGEGSTDAAAWRYPQIFLEPTFALYEINLYIRIAAICQPLSILQWQYTSDYSLLWGAGIYGSDGALRPTQRFWNLQQLSDTPESVFALPFTCSRKEVNCAAFGSASRGQYAVHLVNNGAGRTATIKGLPSNLSDIKIFATNSSMSRQEIKNYKVSDGNISLELPPTGFVTVIAK